MAYPDGKLYWLSTGHNLGGMLIHYDMPSVISYHLQYHADTYQIITGWGKDVYIDRLIPDALAALAVKAISDDS